MFIFYSCSKLIVPSQSASLVHYSDFFIVIVTFMILQSRQCEGIVDDWRDSMAARCGCGGVWSLRALLQSNHLRRK